MEHSDGIFFFLNALAFPRETWRSLAKLFRSLRVNA